MSHYHLPHNHGQDIDKVLDKMPAEENFRDIAILFQQLSDPSRLRLLWLLCHSEECVCTNERTGHFPPLEKSEKQRPDYQPQGGKGSLLYFIQHRPCKTSP